MPRLVKRLALCLLFWLVVVNVSAASFVVRDIRIEGLQGISRNTVLSYASIRTGQRFDTEDSSELIRRLYATGFFSAINLGREGGTLIIRVVERPMIESVVVTGNQEIPKNKFDEVLKNLGLARGRPFNQSTLDQVKKSLEIQYDNLGKYSARINTVVVPQPNHRVTVQMNISEGLSVLIAGIDIVGNHAFSRKTLLKQLPITTPRLWSFVTGDDQYNRDKLDGAVEILRNYYLDRGYLKFKVDSVQATLTPDRKHVYLIIHITEGQTYTIKGYRLLGNLVLSKTKLQNLIHLKSGSLFSRKAIQKASEVITDALGDMGYAFASVNPIPEIDEQARTVFITFYVDSGNRVYLRRINFIGNLKTQDTVFRRLVRQMEGSLISTSDIKESQRQLNNSGYLDKDVVVQTVPVPDAPDQVDLNFDVKEAPGAQATFGVGYGTNGITLTASLNQNNFLGTGNRLAVNFNTSLSYTLYSISYSDPYYTIDGIQRSINLYYQHSTPSNMNIASYITNSYGGSLGYTIPMSSRGDNLSLSLNLQKLDILLGGMVSQEINQFVVQNGSDFQQALFNIGWGRNNLDRYPFATKGLAQDASLQIALPLGGSPLDYYKINYGIHAYYPLIPGFVATARASLGYGNGFASTASLPFFANYYAGGVGYYGQVRGYAANTLGPKDSNGNALGGNILTVGSLGLVFPTPLTSDNLRSTLFVDAGNAFTTLGVSTPGNPAGGTPAGTIRYSAGLAVDWRVPVFNAVLSLSVAKAINPQYGDLTEAFQFNIGTSF